MMLRWCAPFLLLSPSPALAKADELCRALQELKQTANRYGPQRIAIFKEEAMTFACGRATSIPAQVSFCDAAAGPVGVEFTHVFPWLIYDCLRAAHIESQLKTVDQYTGITKRKKITRLLGKWRDGTHIDISFEPYGDFGPEPKFRDYWGAYKLVIWRP